MLTSPAIVKRKRIWVASDPHFFHSAILEFRGADGGLIRPGFSNISEMNAHILEAWNAKVKHGDVGYWLGDMVIGNDADRAAFRTLWPKFNGSKRLVLGNHDDPTFLAATGLFKRVAVEKSWNEYGLMFSHRPLHETELAVNDQMMLNVHGHIHEKASPPGPYLNVSVEAISYIPLELEELIARREAIFGPWRDRDGHVRRSSTC